jgi:hypothetical protein
MRLAVAALRREPAGQERDEAAARLRPVGVGLLEQHAAARERVDLRARRAGVAVGAEVVGAQRVDRHQQHVQPVPGAALRAPAGPCRTATAGAGTPPRPSAASSSSARLTPPPRSGSCAGRRRRATRLTRSALPPGRLAKPLRPLDGEDAPATRQLLEAELALVAVAAQPVEVGVVERQPAGIGGQQDEGRARDLLGVGAEPAREPAHEGGLAGAELSGQQHDLAALEAAGQLGATAASRPRCGSRARGWAPPRRPRARRRPPCGTLSIASGSTSTRSPATSPSSPICAATRSPARPWTNGAAVAARQRPVPREERPRDAGQHVARSAGRHSGLPVEETAARPPGSATSVRSPSARRSLPSRARAPAPTPRGPAGLGRLAPRRRAISPGCGVRIVAAPRPRSSARPSSPSGRGRSGRRRRSRAAPALADEAAHELARGLVLPQARAEHDRVALARERQQALQTRGDRGLPCPSRRAAPS